MKGQSKFTSKSSIDEAIKGSDSVIIIADHNEFKHFKWTGIEPKENIVMVDTKNIFPNGISNLIHIGLGKAQR